MSARDLWLKKLKVVLLELSNKKMLSCLLLSKIACRADIRVV